MNSSKTEFRLLNNCSPVEVRMNSPSLSYLEFNGIYQHHHLPFLVIKPFAHKYFSVSITSSFLTSDNKRLISFSVFGRPDTFLKTFIAKFSTPIPFSYSRQPPNLSQPYLKIPFYTYFIFLS